VGPAYVVFSLSPEARVDVAAWDGHARRFFATQLALAGDPDAAEIRVAITPPGAAADARAGERRIAWRARREEDLTAADEAERRAGGGGLAGLARRCPTVWLVERAAEDDPLALRLAAILASVHLGPVLDGRGPELFGVKTARSKLDALAR
jgi:hypothetical protein